MTLHIGNAACVLGTVSDRVAFEEILFHIVIFVICISLQLFSKRVSTGWRGKWLIWGFLLSLQITRVCLLPQQPNKKTHMTLD